MRLVRFDPPEAGGEDEERPETCSDCALPLLNGCSSGGWIQVSPGFQHRCPNYLTHVRRRALADCGIPALYRDATLESFRTAKLRGSRQLAENLAACRAWLDAFTLDTEAGLLLAGPTGTGKTHLAAALLRAAVERHPVAGRFEDFTSLVHRIQRTIDREKNGHSGTTESDLLLPVFAADLLVLDDIGARRATPYQVDLLYLIVNTRYSQGQPTIFSTNLLPAKGLEEHVGPRTFSRLHECCARPFLLFDRCDDFRRLHP